MTWTSIKDRIPSQEECQQYDGWFLVKHSIRSRPELSRYDGHDEDYSYTHGWKNVWDKDITHWMRLPDLPKD